MGALSFWRVAEEHRVSLFISRYTFNVLQRLQSYAVAQVVLAAMPVLSPTRYHSRWTRRIREITGLTREDAAAVALASFGANDAGDILGAHWLATCDQPLCNGYRTWLPTLKQRFHAMTAQLASPFCLATLPRLATPEEIIAEWEA